MTGKKAILVILCIMNISTISHAQDLKQIQRRVEKERQVEKIKNEIIKNLENNGAPIYKSNKNFYINNSYDGIDKKTDQWSSANIKNTLPKPSQLPQVTERPMVSIGEPSSSKKDGCLNFKIGKYVKDVDEIVPLRMNLWVHIRKPKEKRKRKHVQGKAEKTVQKTRVNRRTRKDRKRNRKKNRSRKIKLFVSNGIKRLAKMRMVVKKTDWYKIELPISQFPDVIRPNDSFKLCLQCKKCTKKIKLDLYRNRKQQNRDSKRNPTVPFIHIEPRSHFLPHSIYRHKRSNVVKQDGHRDLTEDEVSSASCCKEEVYTVDIMKSFQSIRYPPTINISYCEYNDKLESSTPQLSQSGGFHSTNSYSLSKVFRSKPGFKRRSCSPKTLEAFTYSFIDHNLNIKYASVPDLIPRGCDCM